MRYSWKEEIVIRTVFVVFFIFKEVVLGFGGRYEGQFEGWVFDRLFYGFSLRGKRKVVLENFVLRFCFLERSFLKDFLRAYFVG